MSSQTFLYKAIFAALVLNLVILDSRLLADRIPINIWREGVKEVHGGELYSNGDAPYIRIFNPMGDEIDKIADRYPNIEYLEIFKPVKKLTRAQIKSISRFGKLRGISFVKCEADWLSEDFVKIWMHEKLDFLAIEGCRVNEIPDRLLGARHVSFLGSDLTLLSNGRIAGERLETLDLSVTRSKSIPNLSKCEQLRVLLVAGNPGIAISNQHLPKNLEELVINGSKLDQFPRSLLQLNKLKRLSLSANRIIEVPWSDICTSSLEKIDLSANEITSFAGLPKMVREMEVVLIGNNLSQSEYDRTEGQRRQGMRIVLKSEEIRR